MIQPVGSIDDSGVEEFEHRLGASDSVLWDIEKDPVLRSTITAVALLDRVPDWERLQRRLEHGSHLVPRLRQRVVVPPLRVGAPRWIDDPRFDLDYHLRRVGAHEAPSGADPLRAALDVAQTLSLAPFDRARPLWEFTLVEGLPGGQAAFVQKVHHTVTDGVGGIRLALMLVDDAADTPEPESRDHPRPGPTPSAGRCSPVGCPRPCAMPPATPPGCPAPPSPGSVASPRSRWARCATPPGSAGP